MIIYVVEKGDTIFSIAKKYGTTPERIAIDNAVLEQRSLVVGQAILILYPKIIHTVVRYDTIYSIAKQYNTSVMELLQKNPNLIENRNLKIGMQVVITYTEQPLRSIRINGYAYPYISKQILVRALPYLSSLTIFGYGFKTDGELIKIDDAQLIDLAKQYNVAPILLLSSITEDGSFNSERASILFNNTELQNIIINKLIALMNEKGYAGIDIDFEFIEPTDSDAYVSFLQNLTPKMNKEGLSVHVDLAPKTAAGQAGLLYEGHNYKELGAAVNTVLIMTYEWGYTFGPPMAVAPINKVREVVKYAVSEIPAEKILLGIPNYGYDFTLPYEKGFSRATSIGNQEAVLIAEKNGATIKFDDLAMSPYFEYFDKSGKKHIVWFEDVRSIKAKFDLIIEFMLLGGGYWNIMRPFDVNWSLLSAMFYIEKADDIVV